MAYPSVALTFGTDARTAFLASTKFTRVEVPDRALGRGRNVDSLAVPAMLLLLLLMLHRAMTENGLAQTSGVLRSGS